MEVLGIVALGKDDRLHLDFLLRVQVVDWSAVCVYPRVRTCVYTCIYVQMFVLYEVKRAFGANVLWRKRGILQMVHSNPNLCFYVFFAYLDICKWNVVWTRHVHPYACLYVHFLQPWNRYELNVEGWFPMTTAHHSRLTGSIPALLSLLFCLPTYFSKVHMLCAAIHFQKITLKNSYQPCGTHRSLLYIVFATLFLRYRLTFFGRNTVSVCRKSSGWKWLLWVTKNSGFQL